MRRQIEWHLGHVVRELREQRHLSQEAFGKLAGIDKATVVSVEKMDRNHGRETYEKIARALGFTLAELYALVPATNTEESQRSEAQSSTRPASGTAGQSFQTGTEKRRNGR